MQVEACGGSDKADAGRCDLHFAAALLILNCQDGKQSSSRPVYDTLGMLLASTAPTSSTVPSVG